MFGVLTAAAAIVAMFAFVTLVMNTITAGIQGRAAPVRVLNRPARLITVKAEMLSIDDDYRRVVDEAGGR